MRNRITIRKQKTILFYWLIWMVNSGVYYVFRFFPDFENHLDMPIPLQILLYGTQTGIMTGIYEAYLVRENMNNQPLTVTFVSRLAFYILSFLWLIILVSFLSVDVLDLETLQKWPRVVLHPEFLPLLLFTILGNFAANFVRTIDKKSGHRLLFNSLLGKQQQPLEEQRIFVFLDLKGATALAEKLGARTYSSFLRDYYFMVSNVCAENLGEIYQYAGDGVILTWPMERCRKEPHCLLFFYDLKQCFEGVEQRFINKFGEVPQFKAAIHSGRVIATEVGNYGSELAFHGDTVNTTARLQGLCNLLKKDLLVSETLIYKLPRKHEFKFVECGSFELKGKNREVEVFSVEYLRDS